jgi:hypothetical protein
MQHLNMINFNAKQLLNEANKEARPPYIHSENGCGLGVASDDGGSSGNWNVG